MTERDTGGCAILTVAALAPEMGHDVLLRALKGLVDLDWTLAIAGAAQGPAYADDLAGQAQALGIAERVRIVANPDAASLEALWAAADLFALAASLDVPAVRTALRHGIPVAISETVGANIPMEAGIVYPAGDAEALGKAMRRLIYDRPLRQSLAAGARRTAQEQ